MAGSYKTKKWMPFCLLTTLLIVMLLYPTAAGAYVARSAVSAVPGYGAARSQPQCRGGPVFSVHPYSPPTKPADPVKPAPAEPVSPPLKQQPYSFGSSSYGIAGSGGGSTYSRVPSGRPAGSVSPPAQPKFPVIVPEKPVAPPLPVTPDPPPAGEEAAALNPQERHLFDLVNGERAGRDLPPLQLDAQLTYLARLKSQDMSVLNYFAHESPSYGSSGDMLRNAGISFTLAAENIGVGGSIRGIFDAFMNSSGHRNKIVDSRYTRTGVGVVYKPGRGYLVTQLFLLPR